MYIPKEMVELILSFVPKCKVKQLDIYHNENYNYTLDEQIMNIFELSMIKQLDESMYDEMIKLCFGEVELNESNFYLKSCFEYGWDYYIQYLQKKFKNSKFKHLSFYGLEMKYYSLGNKFGDIYLVDNPYKLIPRQFVIYHILHTKYTEVQLSQVKFKNLNDFYDNTERRFVNWVIKNHGNVIPDLPKILKNLKPQKGQWPF